MGNCSCEGCKAARADNANDCHDDKGQFCSGGEGKAIGPEHQTGLLSGKTVQFHSGEHAGRTVDLGSAIQKRYSKEDTTYRGQIRGIKGGAGQVNVTHAHLQEHARLVGNEGNFASEEQRRYLWSQEPDIAESWAHGEHTAEEDHKMPEEPGPDVKGPMAEKGREKAVKNYSPDQERDERGRFSSGQMEQAHAALDKILSRPHHGVDSAEKAEQRGRDEYFNHAGLQREFTGKQSHKAAGAAVRAAYESRQTTNKRPSLMTDNELLQEVQRRLLINARHCPECGGVMKDGECEDCGYEAPVGNAATRNQGQHQMKHLETGQFLHTKGAGTKQVQAAAKGAHGDLTASEPVGPDGRGATAVAPTEAHGVEADEPDDHTWDALLEGAGDMAKHGAETPARNFNPNHDEQGRFSEGGEGGDPAAAMKHLGASAKIAGSSSPTAAAVTATRQANKDYSKGGNTAAAHTAAAAAHSQAAAYHTSQQNPTTAAAHQTMAAHHQAAAGRKVSNMALTANQLPPFVKTATKKASIASIQAGHPAPLEHAEAAHAAVGMGNSPVASHLQAAQAHQEVASEATEGGDEEKATSHANAAALHFKAAELHRVHNSNDCHDDKGQFCSGGEGGGGASHLEARQGLMQTLGQDPKHLGSARSMHAQLQEHATQAEQGKHGASDPVVRSHYATTQRRAEIGMQQLRRQWGPAVRNTLTHGNRNTYSEEADLTTQQLDALISNCACQNTKRALLAVRNTKVRNAKTQGSNSDDIGGAGWESSVQVGGEDSTPDKHDEGYEEKVESQVKQSKGIQTKKGDPDATANALTANTTLTAEQQTLQWLQGTNAPAAVQAIVTNALRAEAQVKQQLITKLVANIQGDERKAAYVKFLSVKPLDEIRAITNLMPPPPQQQQEPVASFGGPAGLMGSNQAALLAQPPDLSQPAPLFLGQAAPLGNATQTGAVDADLVYDAPTINYKKLARLNGRQPVPAVNAAYDEDEEEMQENCD